MTYDLGPLLAADDDPGPEQPDKARAGIPANTIDRKLEIERRREQVAYLVMAHVPYREIAEMLGIGRSTVGDDVKQIRRLWQANAARHYSEHVAEEMAKLDAVERAWMPKATPMHPLHSPEEVAAAEAATRVLDRVARHRARILGLNAPVRIDASLTPPVAEDPDRSLEDSRAVALRLVREVAGVEDVEQRAIEATSRVRGNGAEEATA